MLYCSDAVACLHRDLTVRVVPTADDMNKKAGSAGETASDKLGKVRVCL